MVLGVHVVHDGRFPGRVCLLDALGNHQRAYVPCRLAQRQGRAPALPPTSLRLSVGRYLPTRTTDAPLRCGVVLFDLDGVLVNSAERVESTWHRWALQNQLDPQRVIEMAHGRRTIETVRLVAPHLAASDEVAALEAGEALTTEGVYEVPGARELLQALPIDAWGIVTSGIRSVATLRIRHTNLPMPRVLVCADEIQHGKPHPEGYRLAANRLGRAAADCVVIEDTPAGLEAARAAGMRAIGVCGTYPANALALADLIIPSLNAMRITKSLDGSELEITVVP